MDKWNVLSEITELRFVARSTKESGWNCTGVGTVVVSKTTSKTIIYSETGTLKSESGQKSNFSNIFRWTLNDLGNSIRLEHLRFGPDNPIFLFDLAPIRDQIWKSAVPHQCINDSYSAVLKWIGRQFEMRWTIKGPNKDEDLQYWYS